MKLLPLKRPARPASTSQTGDTSAASKATGGRGIGGPGNSGETDSNHGIGRGMEFAVMVLLFFGVGYALDRWLDTKPIFMIAFVVLALIGEFVRFWYDYDARMKVLEEQRAASTRSRSSQGDRP